MLAGGQPSSALELQSGLSYAPSCSFTAWKNEEEPDCHFTYKQVIWVYYLNISSHFSLSGDHDHYFYA